jgi:hypothetical protein
MNGYHGTFELVDPRLIVIDKRYQRPQKNTLVQQIAQSPSWEAFGVPTCFKRPNGILYCADGQQRIAGVLRSEKPPKLIPVVWFEMEDLEDEAAVFARINEWRKSLLPLEKHKAKVVAKEPAALAVERAVEKAGYSLGGSTHLSEEPRTIQAVAKINSIYNRIGEEGIVQTLTCIREAWPNDGNGISTHILGGVAELIEEQGDAYNRSKLVTALRKTTPGDVLRKSREMNLDFGGSRSANVRRAFGVLAGLKLPREEKQKQLQKLTK